MFEKLKNIFGNIKSGYEYVVDSQTIFEFMKKEINFSIQNNLAAFIDFNIYYNGEKHHVSTWSDEGSEEINIKLDNTEFSSLEDFINRAKLGTSLISELNGYLKIELTYSDSVFLNEYKKKHPNIKSNY